MRTVYKNNEWYSLAFEESKTKKSVVSTVIFAVYTTLILCSVYILFAALTTAQIGYNFYGFLKT